MKIIQNSNELTKLSDTQRKWSMECDNDFIISGNFSKPVNEGVAILVFIEDVEELKGKLNFTINHSNLTFKELQEKAENIKIHDEFINILIVYSDYGYSASLYIPIGNSKK